MPSLTLSSYAYPSRQFSPVSTHSLHAIVIMSLPSLFSPLVYLYPPFLSLLPILTSHDPSLLLAHLFPPLSLPHVPSPVLTTCSLPCPYHMFPLLSFLPHVPSPVLLTTCSFPCPSYHMFPPLSLPHVPSPVLTTCSLPCYYYHIDF